MEKPEFEQCGFRCQSGDPQCGCWETYLFEYEEWQKEQAEIKSNSVSENNSENEKS